MLQELTQKRMTGSEKPKKRELKCRDFVLDLKSRTHIMGILNVTPDSFYDGGRYFKREEALRHLFAMVEEGLNFRG